MAATGDAPAPGARARAGRRDARAVRRARHPGRPGRGDRPDSRDRARPVYRHFSSKEELYVLTVTRLPGRARRRARGGARRRARSRRAARTLHRDLRELLPALPGVHRLHVRADAAPGARAARERVRVGLAPARPGHRRCSDHLADVLRAGAESGDFAVTDADYMANVLWTQMLGIMHLARIRVGIRQLAPGVPGLFKVAPEDIVQTCVASAMATVGARPR